jgi:hypothetical protein
MSDDRSLPSDPAANDTTDTAAACKTAPLAAARLSLVPLGAKRDVSFPLKLYDALMALDAAGLSHIACFQPHGRCFIVLKPAEFVSTVLSVCVFALWLLQPDNHDSTPETPHTCNDTSLSS